MTKAFTICAGLILAIFHYGIVAGQQAAGNAASSTTEIPTTIAASPTTPATAINQQHNEAVNNSQTIMESVFQIIVGNMNAMDSMVNTLNMTFPALPTTGVSNPEVAASIEKFKSVFDELTVGLLTATDHLRLRVEGLRMGMQTCQESLLQSITKMRQYIKCTTSKKLYEIMNQIRNCTFRALTACKSEVAIIQDGIADCFLEIHNIHMRMAHCVLMNSKNAVPCIEVLTSESPDIIDSSKQDLPSHIDVHRVLEGMNRCSLKISNNADTMC